jgi:hypothetical protein
MSVISLVTPSGKGLKGTVNLTLLINGQRGNAPTIVVRWIRKVRISCAF